MMYSPCEKLNLDRFLFAHLYVDSLRTKRTKNMVQNALEALSKGSQTLEKAYEEAMIRIQRQDPDDVTLAKRVITWIVFAERVLTTTELVHALAVKQGTTRLDVDDLLDVNDIVSVCAGLVVVDQSSQIIRLVHYTAQQYFERIRDAWNPEGHLELARTCLTHLGFDAYRRIRCSTHFVRMESPPFYTYAARNWAKHAASAQDELFDLVCTILLNENLLSHVMWAINALEESDIDYRGGIRPRATLLHVLSARGLSKIADKLGVKVNSDVEASLVEEDYRYHTSLHMAALHGHETMVKWLLHQNSKLDDIPRLDCPWISSGLIGALVSRRKPMVKLLLDSGAVSNFEYHDHPSLEKTTPLHTASAQGWDDVVEILIKQNLRISVNALDLGQLTPLYRACECNHVEVVKLLVDHGADVNLCRQQGRTPIHAASSKGHVQIVKLLLANGADPQKADDRGWIPLTTAADMGHIDLVYELLPTCPDLNNVTNVHRSFLSLVAEQGWTGLLQCVHEQHNADLKAMDWHGRTLLHVATKHCHLETFRYLVSKGVDVLAKDAKGNDIVWYAVLSGSTEMINNALDIVPMPSLQDDGWSLLHLACRLGHRSTIEFLIEKGCQSTSITLLQPKGSWSAYDIAQFHGHAEMLEALPTSSKEILGSENAMKLKLGQQFERFICDGCDLVRLQLSW
jgi:ankyrin repeat protein